MNKDVFPSAMFISEYDFYQFQKVRNSVEKFVLEQLGYAKIVEFKENLNMDIFTGNQRWQLYCLEKFLNLFEPEI